MSENFQHNQDPGDIRIENDFLKMKLMLEHGAVFGEMDTSSGVPAEIENAFLKNIAEFEKQWAKVNYVSVFEKIGRPAHFKPVAEIPEGAIGVAWKELAVYLADHGLELQVYSPAISDRELYRFTTEELFLEETEDLTIPGMSTFFIYDEFHPDPVYDNTQMVERGLINDIFRKEKLHYQVHYLQTGFSFNGRTFESWASFEQVISNFKSAFDEIILDNCLTFSCEVKEDDCLVKGSYTARATTTDQLTVFDGNFEIRMIKRELDYWYFKEIVIGGFDPQ